MSFPDQAKDSCHPEAMDGTNAVYIWATSNFSQGQENQGVERRRTWYVAQARPQIDAEIVENYSFPDEDWI